MEYPLRAIEREGLGDGRVAGVGLLVGRNMDRGDAAKLPQEQLDLCEIEPLRQEHPDSARHASWALTLKELRVHPDCHDACCSWALPRARASGGLHIVACLS